jgi:hypothetical protein
MQNVPEPVVPPGTREPSDLDVAISVARELLTSDQLLSVREALRLLLRALGALDAEPQPEQPPAPAPRCPAAHPQDPTPCGGPIVVVIIDTANASATGCEHHGARLLASLEGGRVYAYGSSPEGCAIRVFQASYTIRPFPWIDGPRTKPSQLSREENARRGERG